MGDETVSRNFIEQEIDKDLSEGVYWRCVPDFRRNPTDIFISDMPNLFF